MSEKQMHPLVASLNALLNAAMKNNELELFYSMLGFFLYKGLEAKGVESAIIGSDKEAISIKRIPASKLKEAINEFKASISPTLH